MTHDFHEFDDYIHQRTGQYEYRAIRYRAAANFLVGAGLKNTSTVYDLGAGWTEFDYCLRTEFDWRGRYIPIDGGISELDLNHWVPERTVEFCVALEIIEHLYDPMRLVREMQKHITCGIAISVPNPRCVDVLAIDETHVSIVTKEMLEGAGFTVVEKEFYGGVYSDGDKGDALFATWVP